MSRPAVFSHARHAVPVALGALSLLLLCTPSASALGDSPYLIKFSTNEHGRLLGENGLAGDKGDEVSLVAGESGLNLCWEFYSHRGGVASDVYADNPPTAVVYIPWMWQGGAEQPWGFPLPPPFHDWGIGMQKAGTSPSC